MQEPDVPLHRILRAALLESAGPGFGAGHRQGLSVAGRTAARRLHARGLLAAFEA